MRSVSFLFRFDLPTFVLYIFSLEKRLFCHKNADFPCYMSNVLLINTNFVLDLLTSIVTLND